MDKKFCFISARAGFIKDNALLMDWANGRLVNELLRYYPDMSVAVFSDDHHDKSYDYKIDSVQIIKLPFPYSYSGGIFNTFKILKILKGIEHSHDKLIIQLPFIGFLALLFIKKPSVYHLCANVLTAARNPFKYRRFSLLVSTFFAWSMTACFRELFSRRENRLIVNGIELGTLFQRYSPKVVVSSSVLQKEILNKDDICERSKEDCFRMLFIGRPSKEKGINVLMKAFTSLVDSGHDVMLTMMGVKREDLIGHLVDFKIAENHLKKIEFKGFISWGEEFRSNVRSSHCLLMCSISEGTPRVIIESMALGCPVIASNVGGVPSVIEHGINGLLFQVGNVSLLVDAILRLKIDETFRRKIATKGILKMSEFTVEKFADSFSQALDSI